MAASYQGLMSAFKSITVRMGKEETRRGTFKNPYFSGPLGSSPGWGILSLSIRAHLYLTAWPPRSKKTQQNLFTKPEQEVYGDKDMQSLLKWKEMGKTYSWPFVSVGSASADSTNLRWRILGKKCYIVVDVYYILRPMIYAYSRY